MADLAFLQAVRDTLARSTGATPNPAVMEGVGNTAQPPARPPAAPAPGPQGPVPAPAQSAPNAGDVLLQRLGPSFDPLVSGMQRSFGYAGQQTQGA